MLIPMLMLIPMSMLMPVTATTATAAMAAAFFLVMMIVLMCHNPFLQLHTFPCNPVAKLISTQTT